MRDPADVIEEALRVRAWAKPGPEFHDFSAAVLAALRDEYGDVPDHTAAPCPRVIPVPFYPAAAEERDA
jgi:hypothetical protein